MKLPEFKKFPPFLRLKWQMGLAHSAEGTIVIEKPRHILTSEELDVLISGEGIDVSFDEITILSDGTFGYKDSRVLVYIRDVIKYGNRRKEHDPRYHVMNCITLQTMRANGRFQRYVVAAELSGKFKINIIEGGRVIRSEKKRLLVCQNCLDGLGFLKGFRGKRIGGKLGDGSLSRSSPPRCFSRNIEDR